MNSENKKEIPRCLFSGDLLNEETKIEHAIPAAIGGRITSRRLTSSKFNEATSDIFDKPFVDSYKPILIRLAPLLLKNLQDKSMILKSRDGRNKYRYKNAEISVDKVIITERDQNGHPQSCIVPEEPGISDLLKKKFNWDSETICSMAINKLPDPIIFHQFEFTLEAHISALKSILLSFDEMLNRIGAFRFTREAELSPVRNFINNTLKNPSNIIISELDKYYWGIQINNKNFIDEILKRYRYKRGEFEHIMIVSSNTASKTLYAIWDVLGIETLGFCFCPVGKWNGPSFSAMIANPILKGTSSPSIQMGDELFCSLCSKNQYKCFALNTDSPSRADDPFFQTLPKIDAYRKAVYLVETTAEKHVLNEFQYISKHACKEDTLEDMLIKRIQGLYSSGSIEQDGLIEKIFRQIQSLPFLWRKVLASDFQSLSTEQKHVFFNDYRRILAALYDPFTPPGHVEYGATKIIHT